MEDQEVSTDERTKLIADLRSLADFFESTPALTNPYLRLHAIVYVQPEDFASAASALGGQRKKDADDKYFSVIRSIGGASVEVYTNRDEVCERVQVGTETVEVEEVVTPAVTKTVTVEQPVYDWECGPLLAKAVA